MDPITIGLLATGAISAGKGIQSAIRARRAKKEIEGLQKNLKDPFYELPPELMQTYGMVQRQGMDRQMPGMSNLRASQDIQTAAMLGDIGAMGGGSSVDRMAAIQGTYQNRMLGEQDIAFKNSQFLAEQQQEKVRNLMSMQPLIAEQRAKQYEQNELNPFLRTSAAISALREKRYQESNNMFDAFGKTLMAGVNLLGGMKNKNVEIPQGAITGSESGELEAPVGFDPSTSQQKMLEITGMNNTGGFNYQVPAPPPYTNPYLSMGQQMGQQMYGGDWQSFLNAFNFQQRPQ